MLSVLHNTRWWISGDESVVVFSRLGRVGPEQVVLLAVAEQRPGRLVEPLVAVAHTSVE